LGACRWRSCRRRARDLWNWWTRLGGVTCLVARLRSDGRSAAAPVAGSDSAPSLWIDWLALLDRAGRLPAGAHAACAPRRLASAGICKAWRLAPSTRRAAQVLNRPLCRHSRPPGVATNPLWCLMGSGRSMAIDAALVVQTAGSTVSDQLGAMPAPLLGSSAGHGACLAAPHIGASSCCWRAAPSCCFWPLRFSGACRWAPWPHRSPWPHGPPGRAHPPRRTATGGAELSARARLASVAPGALLQSAWADKDPQVNRWLRLLLRQRTAAWPRPCCCE